MNRTCHHLAQRCVATLLLALAVPLSGCSDDEGSVDPGKRLCGGQSGVAIRISGAPITSDFCAPNDAVSSRFGELTPGRYDILASFTEGAVTIEIEISFFQHASLPRPLVLTSDPTLSGPDDVWFFYRESQPGTGDVTSRLVSGAFTLTFSEPSIVVATFGPMTIEMQDGQGQTAGMRTISEGYLNLTTDN